MNFRLVVVGLVCVGIVTAGVPGTLAHGADNSQEMQARKAFAAGNWPEALDLFAGLYAETLHPVYLRNIGRCHQKMGDPQRAIGAFRDYLAKGKSISPQERAEIDGYIAEMEKLRGEMKPAGPPPVAAPAAVAPVLQPVSQAAALAVADVPQPVYKRWWFWTAAGVVVAGAVTAALLIKRERRAQWCPISGGNSDAVELLGCKP